MKKNFDFLLNHRSIRAYQNREIDPNLLNQIIDCGIRAATSGNMQFYSIIKTTDSKVKEALFEAHERQDMILQAPCVLTFCADLRRVQTWMENGNAATQFNDVISLLRGFVDATIAAQAIVAAAESEGLGTCYMGTTLNNCEKVISTLSIPKLVMPVTSLVIGWPDENPELRPRLPRESVMHEQIFEKKKYDNIASIYKEKNEDTIARWSKNPDLRDKMATLNLKNAAQFYENMKYSNEALAGFSDGLTKIIDEYFGIDIK